MLRFDLEDYAREFGFAEKLVTLRPDMRLILCGFGAVGNEISSGVRAWRGFRFGLVRKFFRRIAAWASRACMGVRARAENPTGFSTKVSSKP